MWAIAILAGRGDCEISEVWAIYSSAGQGEAWLGMAARGSARQGVATDPMGQKREWKSDD
jgi:hypothetical protein